MSTTTLPAPLLITHISTASALIQLGPITFLTDPVFDPSGSSYPGPTITLVKRHPPALGLQDLPPIDAVLLSHEDHLDNLDIQGRTLLNGRQVFTTPDGAKNLAPRPGVRALKPWETIEAQIAGKRFKITGTPCVHVPGGEVTGFVLENEELLGRDDASGKPNAIYFSGDTIYVEELKKLKEQWNVKVAILNLGSAEAPMLDGKILHITLNGQEAVQLYKDIGAEVLVPIHFEGWDHFTQGKEGLRKEFEEAGIAEKVAWLTPGEAKRIA